jgi:hypothetical protein
MDALKALIKKKKEEKQELLGDKKQIRRSELEEARLKRLRGEEEQERQLKVRTVTVQGRLDTGGAAMLSVANSVCYAPLHARLAGFV